MHSSFSAFQYLYVDSYALYDPQGSFVYTHLNV